MVRKLHAILSAKINLNKKKTDKWNWSKIMSEKYFCFFFTKLKKDIAIRPPEKLTSLQYIVTYTNKQLNNLTKVANT